MKNNFFRDIMVLAVIALPLLYFYWVYNTLPNHIPVHFNFKGKADGFTTKSHAWVILSGMALISGLVYLIAKYIPRLDPKKTASISTGTYQTIAAIVVFFISALSVLIVYSSAHQQVNTASYLYPLMGIFFMLLGNFMINIKPNYFVGIRVPWTLDNEENWRVTHRFGSKLWVVGGLLITLLSLLLPLAINAIVFPICVCILAFVPIVYSFIYFKLHRKQL